MSQISILSCFNLIQLQKLLHAWLLQRWRRETQREREGGREVLSCSLNKFLAATGERERTLNWTLSRHVARCLWRVGQCPFINKIFANCCHVWQPLWHATSSGTSRDTSPAQVLVDYESRECYKLKDYPVCSSRSQLHATPQRVRERERERTLSVRASENATETQQPKQVVSIKRPQRNVWQLHSPTRQHFPNTHAHTHTHPTERLHTP